MKITITTIIVLFSLALSGCALNKQADQVEQVSDGGDTKVAVSADAGDTDTQIDTSDWKVYENEEYGLYFEYPEEWPLPFVDKRYPIDLPLDSKADKFIKIRFSKVGVFANIFSDQIEQSDVQEGSPHIFNPFIDFDKSIDSIEQNLIKNDQYTGLSIEKIEKITLNKKPVFLIYERRGYIAADLYQTIVAPNFFEAKDKRNHLMAGIYLAPIFDIGPNDEEIVYPLNQTYINESVAKAKSESRLNKFNKFLESIKRY